MSVRHRIATGSLARSALALAVVMVLLAGCSDDSEPTTTTTTTTSTLPPTADRTAAPEIPRYGDGKDGLRLQVSANAPLFLYNVYIGADVADAVATLRDVWPYELLPYLGVQAVFPSQELLPADERAEALDEVATATDTAQIPLLVQTATFVGDTGPSGDELDAAFEAHPSLVGISIAELSAAPATASGGLQPDQKELIAERVEEASRNDALFLWADMGYVGPQVFVDAGADQDLYDLFAKEHERIVVQAKQNGLGRRFGTMSAAFGLYAAGLADNWGINSEDWLWWEASLERLYGPQVDGPFTAAGASKSDYPARARLTYPEALFGLEMLPVAAAGGTVFSIEDPTRGTVDLERGQVTPAGEQVVFPTLERLIDDELIPTRREVLLRTPVAYQPPDRDPPELGFDQAFSGLYGPEGCTEEDRLACAQRQWLPSTGRFGIIPTLPVLAGDKVTSRFDTVLDSLAGTDEDRVAAVGPSFPADQAATGTAWVTPAAGKGRWFVANPNENDDVRAEFGLPPSGEGLRISGELGPQGFGIISTSDEGGGAVDLFIDNFRTSTAAYWDEDVPDDEVVERYRTDPVTAAPDNTIIVIDGQPNSTEPQVNVTGAAEVTRDWLPDIGRLTLTITHRGPTRISVR